MTLITKLYQIPYIYDEPDDSYPIKYVNDLPCAFGAKYIQHESDEPGAIPLWGRIEVTCTADVHTILEAYDDVTLLSE